MQKPDIDTMTEADMKKEAMVLMQEINSGRASLDDTLRLKKIYEVLVSLEEKEKNKSDWLIH